MTADQANNQAPVQSRPVKSWARLGMIAGVLLVVVAAVWWFSPMSAPFRYERADLVTLSRIAESRPKDALAWRTLGLRLAAKEDPLAEKPLTEAFALDGSDYEVATALGGLYLGLKRYGEAFQLLRRTTETFPSYVPARIALGRLYQIRGSYHHAAEQFEAAVQASKDDSATWYDLAQCYSHMQQSDKAKKAIQEALRTRPKEPKYISFDGTLDAAGGNVELGLRKMTDAANLAPENMIIQGALLDGLIKYQRGPDDLRQAGQIMDRMYEVIPNAPRLMYLRGELARLSGDIPGAIKQLNRVRTAAPQLDDTYYSLGRAYQQAGHTKEAEETLAIYRQRKELRLRVDEVRTALGSKPSDTVLLTQLADLQVKTDDLRSALDTLESANQIDPKDPGIQNRLSSLRAMLGQNQPAP